MNTINHADQCIGKSMLSWVFILIEMIENTVLSIHSISLTKMKHV